MKHMICEVTDGLRPAEATVMVRDFSGRSQFLPLDRRMLARANGHYLLPVYIVHQDDSKGVALVELPDEADSGTWRIWIRVSDFQQPESHP